MTYSETHNMISKSESAWNINNGTTFDTDAIFTIDGCKYKLNYQNYLANGFLSATHQADYEDLMDPNNGLINSDGTFNVEYLRDHSALFTGQGPLNNKPLTIATIDGQETVCVSVNGQNYSLESIMRGQCRVRFKES